MEPPCSSTYHIPDDVYLLENCPIRDSSIIESHLWLSQRIIVVFIMCTNSSLKSFSNQIASHEVMLATVYPVAAVLKNHRLLLPAHPRYGSRSQGETTPGSALTVHHTACPISISISKWSHISDSVS
jgi:hypothetical protein